VLINLCLCDPFFHSAAFCHNREPLIFHDTICVVDRFHWYLADYTPQASGIHNHFFRWNHVGCGNGFSCSNYPIFDALNTQLVEQRNAKSIMLGSSLCLTFCNLYYTDVLYCSRSTVSYMTLPRFMLALKVFYAHSNTKKRDSIAASSTKVKLVY